jgi:orotate phosphoribosyltransferase
MRAFSIRKAAKEHGLGGRLVGPVSPRDAVTVVEDTATTGGALLEAVDVLSSARIEVVQAVVLVDRSEGQLRQRLAEREIPLVSLVKPSDLGVD